MNAPGQLSRAELERLQELGAAEALEALAGEERAEFEELMARATEAERAGVAALDGELAGLTARAVGGSGRMPLDAQERLRVLGEAMVGGVPGTWRGADGRNGTGQGGAGWRVMAVAAGVLLAGAGVTAALMWRTAEREARSARELAGRAEQRFTAAEAENARLAERLADATAQLDRANLRIAALEAPEDPAVAATNRRKLLEVPGTLRLAWKAFDLPDAPAEQRDVAGDVVWNDELEQGYLRFVGLKVNDPGVEQYQVWVIDERGMEQKVSGGVFNASADGEVIVPIHPGIDVRRVALFAVTIEEPGGTWVPSLKRRVVVAPRES